MRRIRYTMVRGRAWGGCACWRTRAGERPRRVSTTVSDSDTHNWKDLRICAGQNIRLLCSSTFSFPEKFGCNAWKEQQGLWAFARKSLARMIRQIKTTLQNIPIPHFFAQVTRCTTSILLVALRCFSPYRPNMSYLRRFIIGC